MIWIVLVLAVLCIAMSCVALWYREKWQDCERSSVRKLEYNFRCQEIKLLRDELKQSDDLCDLLRKLNAECNDDKLKLLDENVKLLGEIEQLRGELGDMEVKCRQFRDHINILRQQLPKRDSKGRFVKR